MTEAIIRDANVNGGVGDDTQCAEIYGYFVENSTVSFEYAPPLVDGFRDRMVAALRTHEWIVAERDATILGFAHAGPWNPRPAYDWSCETTIYLRTGFERHGLGTALYRDLIDRLRSRGFHLAIGRIALPNPASEKVHRALGFQPVGVHRGLGYKHGAWVDVLHTALVLNDGDGAPAPVLPRSPGEQGVHLPDRG